MKYWISTILILGIFSSCSKGPKCWGENKNKGIIENALQINCEPVSDEQEFIISDEASYQQVFTHEKSVK